ncbi:MAG: DUF2279 domain-containing protein [Saprospiraceae bacterium]
MPLPKCTPILVFYVVLTTSPIVCQNKLFIDFWKVADTLNETRLTTLTATSAVTYIGTTLAFNELWYKDYPRVKFHLKDDWILWEQVDKYGHAFSAYQSAKMGYNAFKWTGISDKKAVFIGMGISIALMNTLEIMDGFSKGWGFSLYDAGFNTFGTTLFTSQQLAWKEQKIAIKWSSTRPKYATTPITTNIPTFFGSQQYAAEGLYGRNFWEYAFKDYNAMTIWASISPASFFMDREKKNILRSMCLSVGLGGENIYGAAYNNYRDKEGRMTFIGLPRYKQFYLSIDINTEMIPSKSKLLRTVFKAINFIKIPAPTIELNTLGQFKFHPIRW